MSSSRALCSIHASRKVLIRSTSKRCQQQFSNLRQLGKDSEPSGQELLSKIAEQENPGESQKAPESDSNSTTAPAKRKKTMAELDRELQMRMEGLAGDGGEAGVELEDGQPVAMKRSVRNNMFRYI
ncbi:MAG: hypothetical protein M1820_001157 [Bogoriella megaspora]|nr:MAG: hypothetical protein M1820_001157 [Bogoriella megaspora]